jgi:hypothetical protein
MRLLICSSCIRKNGVLYSDFYLIIKHTLQLYHAYIRREFEKKRSIKSIMHMYMHIQIHKKIITQWLVILKDDCVFGSKLNEHFMRIKLLKLPQFKCFNA